MGTSHPEVSSTVQCVPNNLCICFSCVISCETALSLQLSQNYQAFLLVSDQITRPPEGSCVQVAVFVLETIGEQCLIPCARCGSQRIQLPHISAAVQVNVTLQRAQIAPNEAFSLSLCRWLVEWQLSKDLTWILDTGYWQYVQPTGTNSLQNQLVGKAFFCCITDSWMVIL